MAAKIFSNAECLASLALHHRTLFVNNIPQTVCTNLRWYAKKSGRKRSDCRLAKSDIPPEVELDCPAPCEPRKKNRLGILHWLKLKVVEGGTNFGSQHYVYCIIFKELLTVTIHLHIFNLSREIATTLLEFLLLLCSTLSTAGM